MTDKQVTYTTAGICALILAYFVAMTGPIVIPVLVASLALGLQHITFPQLIVFGMVVSLTICALSIRKLNK